MSYRCPSCNGIIYDRKNHRCGLCGAELPASFQMFPPDMAEEARAAAIPIDLLAQALLELRKARGNSEATRDAAIRYFKGGIAIGFEVGPLLESLMFWPNRRDSVFSEVGYTGNEGVEFVQILKNLSLHELGLNDPTTSA